MIPALLIGRGGSTGLPGKNTMKKLAGRPLMEYPILAAKNARCVDKVYCQPTLKIADVGRRHGGDYRPADHLCDQRRQNRRTHSSMVLKAIKAGHRKPG